VHLRFFFNASLSPLSLLQLVLFGLSNQVVVTFKEENTMTFKNLFLKDYDESSDGSLAVYTRSDVYDHMFYAVEQVSRRKSEKLVATALAARGERELAKDGSQAHR